MWDSTNTVWTDEDYQDTLYMMYDAAVEEVIELRPDISEQDAFDIAVGHNTSVAETIIQIYDERVERDEDADS